MYTHTWPCPQAPVSFVDSFAGGKKMFIDQRAWGRGYNTHTDTPPSDSPRSKELDQDNWIASDRVFEGISCQIEHVTLRPFFII